MAEAVRINGAVSGKTVHGGRKKYSDPQIKTQYPDKIEEILRDPVAARIAFPTPAVHTLHMFTKDIIHHPQHLKYVQRLKLDPRNIVGLLSDDNIREDVLNHKTGDVFPYIHTPPRKRNTPYRPNDMVEILEQFRREHPDKVLDIDAAYVYGNSRDAFKLAQYAHVDRALMSPEGRRVLYRHFAQNEAKPTHSAEDFKTVLFTRVDPETGLYQLNGDNFLYQRDMSKDKDFIGETADPNGHNLQFPGVAPVDEEDSQSAFDKINAAPNRLFFRLVLKDEARGASILLGGNEGQGQDRSSES